MENRKKNILDLLFEIQQIAADAEVDAEKVLKGNKTAGIRLRKTMQKIKGVSQDIRNGVQENLKEKEKEAV